ncbi:hypothetical protein IJ768_02680 [Candidatus Saccharibacteria bacterium]|nr:hypothetical protein [Candidatus Saccharibacteria bacterium]
MNPQQQPTQTAPVPPTNDFLSRMDAVNHPAPAEPPKKKMSKGMIIGIVVGVVAMIGGIVGAILVMNSGKTETKPTVTQTWDDDDDGDEIDEAALARNKLRANDLVPLGTAIQTYQAQPEAEGQLPGLDTEEWETVIKLFVPNGEIVDGATGDLYKMGAVCKFGEDCVDISTLSWEKNAHEIYVLYNADCKGSTKENVIVSSTRLRRAAIFAVVEGDQFICATN